MKKLITSLFLISFFSVCIYAHGPKTLQLNVDLKNKSLKIVIDHNVKDTESHYISDVIISINGQEIDHKKFLKQTSSKSEVLLLNIEDMKEGDKIEVIAKCNKIGQKKNEIVVKSYYHQN